MNQILMVRGEIRSEKIRTERWISLLDSPIVSRVRYQLHQIGGAKGGGPNLFQVWPRPHLASPGTDYHPERQLELLANHKSPTNSIAKFPLKNLELFKNKNIVTLHCGKTDNAQKHVQTSTRAQ